MRHEVFHAYPVRAHGIHKGLTMQLLQKPSSAKGRVDVFTRGASADWNHVGKPTRRRLSGKEAGDDDALNDVIDRANMTWLLRAAIRGGGGWHHLVVLR
jgi:hypothetical protein